MKQNSNTVNIDSTSRSYHHGNLRDALIAAGLATLRDSSADTLSLRDVARSVGVSATSVYRHFPDKQAFIAAICAQGSEMLAKEQHLAMQRGGGGQVGFDASGLAYVHFALANPALFRLMTTARLATPDSTHQSGAAWDELQTNVATLPTAGTTAQDQKARALRAWSIVHGVAMLVLEGRIENDDSLIMAIISEPSS